MPFPEQINLPFNYSSIKKDFILNYQMEQQPEEKGCWAIIQGNSLVLKEENGTLSLPEGDLPEPLLSAQRAVHCIGSWRGRPLRAFSITPDLTLAPPFTAEIFNATNIRMDIQKLTLGGVAKQVLHWLSRSRYCSHCGGETVPITGSWGKRCPECKGEHYPHLHPCAIVLVKRGNQLLLTRKKEWIPGRYSLVAGFVDFGESLEECAIREIKEETGITAENIRYVGSQNWPFPAQLMAGFVADYVSGEIVVDYNELEDARWFNIDALPDLPPQRSIARYIIDNYAV